MKQQQAGIIEAKAAIRRADETVIQGRSIVVFTVVTIFFVSQLSLIPVKAPPLTDAQLPLSFFATVFGMNNRELDTGSMSIGVQFMWMCKQTFVRGSVDDTLLTKATFSCSL